MKYLKKFNESDSWAGSMYAYGNSVTPSKGNDQVILPLHQAHLHKCKDCDMEFYSLDDDIFCLNCGSTNYEDINESYNNEQEYINDIIDKFKVYNIRPLVLNKILDFYKDQIIDDYNNDKQPSEFVDMIVKDMELGSGGYMSQNLGSNGWSNKVVKYL